MTDKSIRTLIKDIGNDPMNPPISNLMESYEYIGENSVAGMNMMLKFMDGSQDKLMLHKWIIGSILGFELNTEKTISGKNDLLMIPNSEPIMELIITAFFAGMGVGAKEEIR